MTQYNISIIIPVLNEATIIQSTLLELQKNQSIEIIVVDGGSQDNTIKIVQQTGAKLITATGGKAAQMNQGANIAQSELLLFLHGDTHLPQNFIPLVRETLNQPKVVAGAFELAINGKEKSFRWVELMVKIRSRLFSLPYGDQGIFIRKNLFEQIGGYRNLPIMEDFDLIQRLKRQGEIAIASGRVLTSGRRWQKLGVWQTTVINQLVIVGYYLGISPAKLRNLYFRQHDNSNIRKSNKLLFWFSKD